MAEKNKALLMSVRAGLLAIVDGIEDYLGMDRTKNLRRAVKEMKHADNVTHSGNFIADEA